MALTRYEVNDALENLANQADVTLDDDVLNELTHQIDSSNW